MHAMVGLFAAGVPGEPVEMVAASADPALVADTAARLAAGGDAVAARFLASCVRDATAGRRQEAPDELESGGDRPRSYCSTPPHASPSPLSPRPFVSLFGPRAGVEGGRFYREIREGGASTPEGVVDAVYARAFDQLCDDWLPDD